MGIAHSYPKNLEWNLKAKQILEKEQSDIEKKDGFVFEELGELYLTFNFTKKSQYYFKAAHQLLSQDIWLQANEKERLERMKQLANL